MLAHEEIDRLEKEIQKLKEDINSKSEELDIRQRCLKEFQMKVEFDTINLHTLLDRCTLN